MEQMEEEVVAVEIEGVSCVGSPEGIARLIAALRKHGEDGHLDEPAPEVRGNDVG